jgi:hypothetical protein
MKNYIVLLCLLISTAASAKQYNNVQVMPQSGTSLIPIWGQVLLTSPNAVTGESAGACYATGTSSGLVFGILPAVDGGLGINTSASTGVPSVSSGTWSINSVLSALLGGTGLNESSATGVVTYSSGTPSNNTFLPVSFGGLGVGTLTSGCLIVGAGTSAATFLCPSANNNVVKDTGTGFVSASLASTYTAPTFQTFTNAGVTTTGTVSTASVCITSVGSLSGINIGSGITDATTNGHLPKGQFVVAIPGSCSAGQIQMNAVATVNGSADSLVFGAMGSITSATLSNATACITNTAAPFGIVVGSPVYDLTHPSAISANTTVAAIPGTCGAGFVQMSANAALTESASENIVFGQVYNRPSTTPLYINVRVFGGAGGGGSDTVTGASGVASLFSTFMTSNGGPGGLASNASAPPLAGGTATVSSPGIQIVALSGGSTGASDSSATIVPGSPGCSSPLGGAGGGGSYNNGGGGNAATNSASGGGGSAGVSGGTGNGQGGGCGGYIEAQVNSVSATYTVFAGAGGAGAGGTGAGGNGAAGPVIVEEKYQ